MTTPTTFRWTAEVSGMTCDACLAERTGWGVRERP